MRSSQLYNYVLSWLIEQRQRTMLARVPNKITTSRTEADRLEIEVRENMRTWNMWLEEGQFTSLP